VPAGVAEGALRLGLSGGVFAFLTTDPNAVVGAVHSKAMPVTLTTPEEWETWPTAAPVESLGLQRQLPDGSLVLVARGSKMDRAPLV
jgi:putative SOS response-associated peptidase YedK